jgi:hypothetical protein
VSRCTKHSLCDLCEVRARGVALRITNLHVASLATDATCQLMVPSHALELELAGILFAMF